jgi:alpha-galactosidase
VIVVSRDIVVIVKRSWVSVAASLLVSIAAVAAASAAPLASKDDVSITSTESGWVVSNALVTLGVGFDTNGYLVVQDLRSTGDTVSWHPFPGRDTIFNVGDREISLTRSDAAGLRYVGAETLDTGTGLELRLVFEDLRDGLRVKRVYAAYPQVAILETWTELESMLGRSTTVSEMASLQVTVDGGLVTTVDGLGGPADTGGPVALQHRAIGTTTDPIVLEEGGRSTARYLPLVSVTSARGALVTGLMWSGAWRMDVVARPGNRSEITAWLPGTQTTVTPARSVTMPHAILGVVRGDESAVAPALHRFIVTALRRGQILQPLVTYNTWFSTGTGIDRELIADEMAAAANAGAELFELDAGWYEGAGERDPFDFHSGLGSYKVDTRKFPDGLRPLADRAHELGMKFGVWVEPERVDLRTVGEPGMARETWLMQENGLYEPGVPNADARTAMLDLGNPEAREWLLDKLSALVAESGLDQIKWDNNAWVNNTRQLQGAGPNDGNFRHVAGLYELLAALKERFPWLLIENCSGGGNRLDLGLLRYTDAGWMDDRTSPSAHVRHNLQGLTAFLPPAYLLSYLLHDAAEPMHDAPDFALYAQSRMPGVFGLSFPPDSLDDRDMQRVREQTDRWKALRSLQQTASAYLVSPQVDGTLSGPWDGTLLVSPGQDAAVLYAFQNDVETEGANFHLRGLDRPSEYVIASDREGDLGVATGAELMDDGLDVFAAESTRAHIYPLTKVTPEEALAIRRRAGQ